MAILRKKVIEEFRSQVRGEVLLPADRGFAGKSTAPPKPSARNRGSARRFSRQIGVCSSHPRGEPLSRSQSTKDLPPSESRILR